MIIEIGLSLGTNLGDRLGHLRAAVTRIAAISGVTVVEKSNIYETAPVGVQPQHAHLAYLNAVLIIHAELPVETVSSLLHEIEDQMGRERSDDRFAPREIDIDLLYADSERRHEDELTLPHPRWARRRFVVQPLADVRPAMKLPGSRLTVAQVLETLPDPQAVIRVEVAW